MLKQLCGLTVGAVMLANIGQAKTEVEWYLEGKKAVEQNNNTAYTAASKNLQQSLLQPYLHYQHYKKHIRTIPVVESLAFIQKNQDYAFAASLKNTLFSQQLTLGNSAFVLANGGAERTDFIRCLYFDAQIKVEPKRFTNNAAAFQQIWQTTTSLPSSCAGVETYWLTHYATASLIEARIKQLILSLNLNRALVLSKRLSQAKQSYYQTMVGLIRNPSALLSQKTYYKDSSSFYALAVRQWGKNNSTAALRGLAFVKKNHLVTDGDYQSMANLLAVYQAGRQDAIDPLGRINAIPKAQQNDEVKKWGFRLSAKNNDCGSGLEFLARLSGETKNLPTWRYWRGRMHECLGNGAAAQEEYRSIATHPSFYGFLAADHLNQPYTVLTSMVRAKNTQAEALTDKRFQLAALLIKAHESGFGRSEWMNAVKSASEGQKHAASIYGFNQGLYDLSLRAAVSARASGGLYLRYPMAYANEIKRYAKQYGFPAGMVWGLTRQESLFQADVKSHADAYGLMQLLIPTADKMAKRLGEKRQSLLMPEPNVRYGTAYLDYVSTLVGRQWPYVLASYNAGPHRVKEWTAVPMADITLWIETIPYKETRNYVKTVLENAVIYAYQAQDPVKIRHYLSPF